MHRTRNMLQLIVIGLALTLAMLAAPAANAQSVKGSGTASFFGSGAEFKVNVSIGSHGNVGGSVTVKWYQYNEMPGDWPNPHWVKYTAVSLVVVGNTATVTANGPDGALHTFTFTDNGDGSIWPDYFNTYYEVTTGDITVTP